MAQWTRRQVLTQMGLAAAAVHTLDPHELCCTMAAHAQTADKDLFELKKVGDGVYGAIAAPRFKTNCNAAVILTDDGVIVVDSHSKPSASRALYTQIQDLSKKPVIKLINTHFHWDHWQGNESYAATNPKLEIIASQSTKENLTKADSGVGGVPFIEKQIAALPAEIATLKADIQKESDPAKKKNLESNLQQAETFMQEIQLHVLGRAHTNGDLFIYLPKEKVVASGDALIDWMPFMNDGYPEDWINTLTALDKLDFTTIVPGHGDVRPKSQLAFFRGYFVDLIAAVKKAAAGGATLAEMQTKVGDELATKYEAGMSKYPIGRYRDRVGQNVEMIYKKVVQKA
jgi:glyoxylase-like metal-dependent hydrolase (beta-lactamase superfamily II)